MKILRKYWRQMSNRRHAFCYSVLELMERGFKYREAKEMVENSYCIDYAEKHPEIFFHYSRKDWADWIIEETLSVY